ncbi:pilus assembly protein [Methylotuvimicrobium sp. KM2]|uniref:pilus assembly protein n=1 Tax=Methylotuvimicrobium sp. KM2 TaxID=3133976 RepID=UPI003101136B
MHSSYQDIKQKLSSLFDELFTHEGYADMHIEMRILKRGQKEVILHCGKQYRYVADFRPGDDSLNAYKETGGHALEFVRCESRR